MLDIDFGYCPVMYKDKVREWIGNKREALYIHFENLCVTDQQIKDLCEDWRCEDGDYKERMDRWNLDNDDMAILDNDDGAHRDLFDQVDSDRYLDYLLEAHDL